MIYKYLNSELKTKLEEEAIKNEQETKASLVIVIKEMIENGFDIGKISKCLAKAKKKLLKC